MWAGESTTSSSMRLAAAAAQAAQAEREGGESQVVHNLALYLLQKTQKMGLQRVFLAWSSIVRPQDGTQVDEMQAMKAKLAEALAASSKEQEEEVSAAYNLYVNCLL